MKLLKLVVFVLLTFTLASCVVSEKQFVAGRDVVRKRPDLQAKYIAGCVKEGRSLSLEKRELIAAMTDVSVAKLPETFCHRVMRSYLSGRLTYTDYQNMVRGKTTPRLIRIIRGQRV